MKNRIGLYLCLFIYFLFFLCKYLLETDNEIAFIAQRRLITFIPRITIDLMGDHLFDIGDLL